MDFWEITRLVFRRWYVAVPLLLMTAGATAYMAAAVRPDYQLTSYVQLVPAAVSPDASVKTASNPWNQLGLDALSQAADYAVLDQTFLDSLKAAQLSTNFSIVVGLPPAGATIQVVAHTQRQAEKSTDAIVNKFTSSVLELQTSYGVRTQDLITTTRLDQGENLKRPGGKVKRAILAVAGVGILFTIATTITVDVIMSRRARRRGAAGDGAEDGAEVDPLAGLGLDSRETMALPDRVKLVPAGARRTGGSASGAEAPARGADETALIPALPVDATISLPLRSDQVRTNDKRSKRR